MPVPWPYAAFYLSLALASGFVDFKVRDYADYAFKTYIPAVLDGSYGAPAIYRVLVPYANTMVSELTGLSAAGVWHLTRVLWYFAAYLIFHVYLRTWLPHDKALAGTSIVAATFPLTLTNSWAHPDHVPELALFTLGCLAVARRHDVLFGVTLVVAGLNRETSVFLLLVYALALPLDRRRIARLALFAGLWLGVYIGLRLWRGFEHYSYWQLGRNIEFLKLLPAAYDPYKRAYAYFGLAIFGPLLYFALRQSSQQPAFVRRVLRVAPAAVAVCFAFSSIIESRIFTPLFPLIMPAVMFGLDDSIRP